MQRRFKITSVFAAVLLVASTGAHAIGFGRASSTATLGQPLNFTVGLRQDAGDEFGPECVSADVHVGDNRLGPPNVRVSIEPGRGAGAERVLRVRTQSVIDEPVVNITLVVGCPPTLTRQFVTLADPPIVTLAERAPEPTTPPAPPPADARASEASATEAPVRAPAAERIAAAQPAQAPRPQRRVAPRATGEAATRRATVVPPAAPQVAQGPAVAAPVQRDVAPEVGDRLKVDPARRPPESAGKAEARPATAADAAAAAEAVEGATTHMLAVLRAEMAARAADGERLRLLEESFSKLQADLRANTAEMAALRARVQQSDGERFSSSLVYGLAGLSTLLSLALGGLLLKRSRDTDRRWWAGGAPQAPETRAPAVAEQAPAPQAAAPRSAVPASKPMPLRSLANEHGGDGVVVEEVHSRPAPLSPETRPADAQPRREVTVEELIDLEQQAEFFVVLGQDEAAIDLLMNHLRNTGGISPLPYLKLLEIYRKRADRIAYERMRERFNRRFNAYAPDWESDTATGRSLDEYPDVMARLQRLWPEPDSAMHELESMLFRRDEGETFDLPAYNEVLFLYSLARDVSENPDLRDIRPSQVDLLLPLADDASPRPAAPLVDTMSMEPRPAVEKPLSLDLDISVPGALGPAEEPRASR